MLHMFHWLKAYRESCRFSRFFGRIEPLEFDRQSGNRLLGPDFSVVCAETRMPGKVVHFELPADNVERAKNFY
jgi:hypothetical protein